MGKRDTDQPSSQGGRKRQLNVIYFIDSAKTRSFTVPIGRLNVMLLGLVLILAWSAVSVVLLVWTVRGRDLQSARLKAALATIFEYEVRDDGVFDLAYPPAGKNGAAKPEAVAREKYGSPTGIDLAGPNAGGAKPPAAAHAAQHPAAHGQAQGKTDETKLTVEKASAGKTAGDKSGAGDAEAAGDDSEEQSAEETQPAVSVSNPVLEAKDTALQLRFDLTSKATSKVEGYIWAVAEFQADSGERLFIGAPGNIGVKADGEPTYPQRSALFAIRRFKQKVFSFPYLKDKSGTFVGVKIGVMERSGEGKTTYSVPVKIPIGNAAKDDGTGTPPGAPG
jgi:hypothetical protein